MKQAHKLSYIWDAILKERKYQDTHKGQDGKNKHDIPGWVLIMRKQLDTAVMEWLDGDVDKSLAEILQATAVGIACLQQHGVPDTAFRATQETAWEKLQKMTILGAPAVVQTRKLNEYPDHSWDVYTWEGIFLVRISEVPLEIREKLKVFLRGQTMPVVEGEDPQDWTYLHDFENFMADGKLFWD